MADADPRRGLMPSILDRLIDPSPPGASWWRDYGVAQATDAVRRDLEDLLNTHRSRADLPAGFVELEHSVFTFGVPDAAGLTALALEGGERIGRLVEDLIGRFEPRLREVRVRLVDPAEIRRGRVRFRIEARLRLEPAPEVEFETVLELATGHASVAPGV